MELRQLRYLVALADERQFTRAAQRLHIAQPALSQQIAKLEREVGVSLVDRTTRHVALTEAGELLVAHARRMLAEADLARAELDDLAGVRTGRLSIGATQTIGPVDLSGLLATFHAAYPGVELAVREDLSFGLAAALRRDELDIAFVTTAGDDRRGDLEFHQVASEELVAIVAPDHALAGRASLRLKALRDDAFVGFRGGATIRRHVDDAAQRAGFVPQVAFETNDVARMRSLVSAGLGVAVLPRSDAERPGPAVATVAIGDDALDHVIFAAWRTERRRSPATRAFVDMLLGRGHIS